MIRNLIYLSAKIVIFFYLFANSAHAKIVALNDVVAEIMKNSNSIKSSEYSLNASENEALKAQKHWLPTLYIDSSAYQTNDPTKTFIGNLYQRSVRASDFNPSAINKINSAKYSKSSVGVNLPIYQGGSGVAFDAMTKNLVESKRYDLKQVEIDQYSYVVSTYIALVALVQQKIKLEKIAKNIDEILKKYALRDKKNQIGFSGFLILQASENKAKSFIIDNQEKTQALYTNLKVMGFESEAVWNVENGEFEEYIEKYLKLENVENSSFKTSALKAKVDASKNEEIIDNAKNLPQLNLFAENYVFKGNRSTQNGYNAGLNLHWNFFDPFTYNNREIASNNTNASRHQYLTHQQNEKAEIEYLNSQINSLHEATKLAYKNDELMFKNVVISKDLFKNGSISASNLSDSIMKYLDNFVYLANAQMQLIDLYSKKISKQKININDTLAR